MFDILASTYMTASRMDHWMEQDSLHRDPRTAARLRRIHGLDDPSIRRELRGRIGMDGAIERPRTRPRFAVMTRTALARLGTRLRRAGEWMEGAAATSYRREICGSAS